jgi:hypothetical protein
MASSAVGSPRPVAESNLTPIGPFTQPIVRFDLDRMDDNDNRLFGVTAHISWVPKPAYQIDLNQRVVGKPGDPDAIAD